MKNLFLSLIICVCCLAFLTLIFLVLGVDPYSNPRLLVLVFLVTLFFFGSTSIGICLYFIKYVRSRGYVGFDVLVVSLRHGILVCLYFISLYIFDSFGLFSVVLVIVLGVFFLLLEGLMRFMDRRVQRKNKKEGVFD